MIVLAGMILAWPNPSSIVPAAILNFAIFTALAVASRLPAGHLVAAMCFALAYLVTFHVLVGNITVAKPPCDVVARRQSFSRQRTGARRRVCALRDCLRVAIRRRRERDSYYYLISACVIGVVSLYARDIFGLWSLEYHALWIVYGLYSLGAFWIAWRHKLLPFTWIGSALLLFSLAHSFGQALSFSFPWQTALFAHATICAIAAIVSSRHERGEVFSHAT